LIIDHGYKVVLCLCFLVVQAMFEFLNGTISFLVARLVAFPTNDIGLLIALVVVVVLIRPLLVSRWHLTRLTIFGNMNLGDMLL